MGSSEGCRYCGRPLDAAAAAVVGAGPPQVLCASCRAASSLDSLVGHGAFASGGLALRVPQAQASPRDADRPPSSHGAPAGPSAPDPGSADVVIDLTDRAVARAAEAAAALEHGAATAPEGLVEPAEHDRTGTEEAGARVEEEGTEGDDAGPRALDADDPEPALDGPTDGPTEATDGGSSRGAERHPGSGPDDGSADAPPATSGPGGGATAPTSPRRPERIPTIRDLTRSTGRPRSALRRAEPLAPAPRPERRPAPPVDSGPSAASPGHPPVAPTLDAAAWSGGGLRRPTVIDLRDGAPAGPGSTAVGPQWSGARERQALRDLLEGAAATGVDVLHDRRAPGCLSAVDHLVVAPSGVWVVDSMGFSGKVRASRGRRLRSRPALHVGGRDRTPLLADLSQRVDAVRTALADSPAGRVPVRGALCFSDEDLGRGAEPFDLAGVLVTSRRHLVGALTAEAVLDEAHRPVLLRRLAERLPPIT